MFLTLCVAKAQETSTKVPSLVEAPLPSALRVTEVVALVTVLMLLHALLSTSEIALITLRKTRLKQLTEEGNKNALLVEKLLSDPTRLMATLRMAITLIVMLAASTATIGIVPTLAHWLRTHYAQFSSSAMLLGLGLVMLPIAGLSIIIGGVIPKSLAMHNNEVWALRSARPIYLLEKCLSPLMTLVAAFSNILLKPFGSRVSFLSPAVNEEEIKMLVEASEEQGVLEAEETEMITSVLDFSDTVVRKVMTPRIDMASIAVTAPLTEVLALIRSSGHTRIPVYEGDIDNIVGILHAKDLLDYAFQSQKSACLPTSALRPPYFIPETKKIDELLTDFRKTHQQLAIVRDEYGLTSGLVSLEDLIEEIVGEIEDEYDNEQPMMEVLDAENTLFDGRTSLKEVNDRMGLALPLDESDTLAGFVFGLIGHQAEVGESANWENLHFVVEATDGRRITKIRLCHPTP
jgi:putative hemolysin